MVSHSFEDYPSSMYWDDDRDVAVFVYQCQERHSNPNMPMNGGMSAGPMMGGGSSDYCEAEKEVRYEVGSVKDDGDTHEGPYGYEIRDGATAYGDVVHKDTVDELPEWVDDVLDHLRAKVNDVDVDMLLTDPRDKEFDMMVVRENEYSVYFHRVDEEVSE